MEQRLFLDNSAIDNGERILYSISEHSISVRKKIVKARNEYHKHGFSDNWLLEDYCYLYTHDKTGRAHNIYRRYVKEAYGQSVESGVTEHETAFMFDAFQIRNELPTDVVNGLFYGNRNDGDFELHYLLPLFQKTVGNSASKIMIINPSPDMILQWNKEKIETTYMIPDDKVRKLYLKQFENHYNVAFCSLDDLYAGMEADYVLFTCRDMQREEINRAVQNLPKSAQNIILAPTMYMESNNALQNLLPQGQAVQEILLLPRLLFQSYPRRKCLVFARPECETKSEQIRVFHSFISDTHLKLSNESPWIERTEFIKSKTTWNTLYRRALSPEAERSESYDKAITYDFSPEIQIFCTFCKRGNRIEGMATYRPIIRKEDGELKRAKAITPRFTNGLRGDTQEEVIEKLEKVPFYVRPKSENRSEIDLSQIISNNILDAYDGLLDSLSMKTIWFCIHSRLKENHRYRHDIALWLFRNSESSLSTLRPARANAEDFISAMDSVLSGKDAGAVKYWKQIDLYIETAIKAGILSQNPIKAILSSVSDRATQRQQQIRNAMTKKNLEISEENTLIQLFFGEARPRDNSNLKLPGYIVDSKLLLCAVRFFTGMSNSEACALTLDDYVYVKDPGFYQLSITKYISQGKLTYYMMRNDYRIRVIPIPTVLAGMINQRIEYLEKQFSLDKTQYAGKQLPLFYEREPKTEEEFFANQACKTSTSSKYAKMLIDKLGIDSQIVVLPGDENSDEDLTVDLYNYQGDIFRSNFRFHANHDAGLQRGELSFYLGIKPPNTYSSHYCDFSNQFIQFGICQKLERWTNLHDVLFPALRTSPVFRKLKVHKKERVNIIPEVNCTLWSLVQIPISEDNLNENIEIVVESEHGICGNLVYHDRESNDE